MSTFFDIVAKELGLKSIQVENTMKLLDEGATVPFLARYRKEQTDNLDETEIRNVLERVNYLRNLDKRKEEVIKLIEEQGKLTPELKADIEKAVKLQEVEDLYLPYKKKRKTKADVAKEQGLEPFAEFIKGSSATPSNVKTEAENYLTDEVDTIEKAIEGAHLILAQEISEVAVYREKARTNLEKRGTFEVKATKKAKELDEKQVYKDYYEHIEDIARMPSHRIMAVNRGEKEKILNVSLKLDSIARIMIEGIILKNLPNEKMKDIYLEVIGDALDRLILPSIEREVRNILTERAEIEAIATFKKNLGNLLLQPPLEGKAVLGLDPAYRTGCKTVVIDKNGFFQTDDVLYLVEDMHHENQLKTARKKITELVEKYNIDLIAIGNGTASRETESFVAKLIPSLPKKVHYLIVNEAGASVYSASPLAKEEFPDLDVTARGAISIAKRIQDPLAELVKIDPKSIGVGMYQHDVNQKKLDGSLDEVIEDVVNSVGVNVNTASYVLLSHVSGIKKNIAKNIESYRKENGSFKTRKQLLKVKGLGAKAYEQMAGFIVIPGGEHPLENTTIHPESYGIAEAILKDRGYSLKEYEEKLFEIRENLKNFDYKKFAMDNQYGEATTKDIYEALVRDRRDPRDELEKPMLKSDILKLSDLKPGMELEGTVRNVVNFGAFIDIGLKNDALLHISEMSNKRVKDPTEIMSVGDIIKVRVKDIDEKRSRVGLTKKEK